MSGTGYPVAPAPAAPVSAQVVAEPRVLTPEEQAEVDSLYEELKPEATETARNYVLSRTPAPPVMTVEEARTRREDLLSWSRRAVPFAGVVVVPDPPAGQPYYPPQR